MSNSTGNCEFVYINKKNILHKMFHLESWNFINCRNRNSLFLLFSHIQHTVLPRAIIASMVLKNSSFPLKPKLFAYGKKAYIVTAGQMT